MAASKPKTRTTQMAQTNRTDQTRQLPIPKANMEPNRIARSDGKANAKPNSKAARQEPGGRSKTLGVSAAKFAAKPPRIPGEKEVKPTKATIPVGRRRPTKAEKEPMPLAAMDRRRQVLDDEPPATTTAPTGRNKRTKR